MKIFSVSVLVAPPGSSATLLSNASDLSSFSFYQKGSVGEFMTFLSKTVAERTSQGQRQSVQENNYVAHVYNRGGKERLAGELECRIKAQLELTCLPAKPSSSRIKNILFDQHSHCLRKSSMNSPLPFHKHNTILIRLHRPLLSNSP